MPSLFKTTFNFDTFAEAIERAETRDDRPLLFITTNCYVDPDFDQLEAYETFLKEKETKDHLWTTIQ